MRRALAVVALVASSSSPARGQEARAAFSVERFTPSPGAGGFLVATGPEVQLTGAWSVSMWGSLMHDPLVLNDLISGERVSEPVRVRLGYELAGALGLTDRLEIGFAMPVIAAQDGDRLQGIDLDESSLAPIAFGDVRFHGKLRLTRADARAGLAIAARASLPTGDHESFAGEAAPTLAWSVIAGYRAERWRIAASVGPRLRTEKVVLLSPARPHGSEVELAAGAEVRAPGTLPLAMVAEYFAVRGESVAPGTGVRGPSPREVRAGLRWMRDDGWSFTAGGGFGVTPDDVGAPAWRVIFGARFERKPRTIHK